jgi:hypothetical protein
MESYGEGSPPDSIEKKLKNAIHKVSKENTNHKSENYNGGYIGESGSGSWNTEAKHGKKEEFKQDPLIEQLKKEHDSSNNSRRKRHNNKGSAISYPISHSGEYSNSPGIQEKFPRHVEDVDFGDED